MIWARVGWLSWMCAISVAACSSGRGAELNNDLSSATRDAKVDAPSEDDAEQGEPLDDEAGAAPEADAGDPEADATVVDAAPDAGMDAALAPDAVGAADAAGDATVAAPDSVVPDAGDAASVNAADAAQPPAHLSLLGCAEVSGQRPSASSSTTAPQVASVTLGSLKPGAPLDARVAFRDLGGDAASVIVQVDGADKHHVCPLSADERAAGSVLLSALSISSSSSAGTFLLYVSVRDVAGNVGGYVTATLVLGAGSALPVCQGPASAVQLVGSVPSASTDFYAQQNGASEYRVGSANGPVLQIVRSTRVLLERGTCRRFGLAGDALGEAPVGWDNCLVVEYRAEGSATVSRRWSYCSTDTASPYHLPTGTVAARAASPSVPGTSLTPQVPNGGPFGFPALAIDLLADLPEADRYELTLLILDYGSVGSSTDIWLLPG